MEQVQSDAKITVGLVETVYLAGHDGPRDVAAKMDTGATRSSIDIHLATELKLGPITKSKMVKSALGHKVRPVVDAEIELAGKKIRTEFTLADRSHMRYKVLVGVNILKNGFMVDPSKE